MVLFNRTVTVSNFCSNPGTCTEVLPFENGITISSIPTLMVALINLSDGSIGFGHPASNNNTAITGTNNKFFIMCEILIENYFTA